MNDNANFSNNNLTSNSLDGAKLSGVGGWLKFYINWNLFVIPFFSAMLVFLMIYAFSIHAITNFHPTKIDIVFNTISLTTQALFLAWRIRLALNLKNQLLKKSVDSVKVFLLVYPVLILLEDALFGHMKANLAYTVGYIMGTFFETIVWYTYFTVSKRVKNTYLVSEEDKQFFDKI
jgi:hypothetical protein